MKNGLALDVSSVAAGAYITLLATGLGPFVGLEWTDLLGPALFGWLVVAFAVERRPSLWVALGRRRLLALPMVVALVPTGLLAIGLDIDGRFEVPLSAVIWMLGLSIAGLVVLTAGTTVYAQRAAGEQRASWTASPDPTVRRRTHVGAEIAGLGAGVAAVVTVFGLPSFVLTLGVATAVVLWVAGDRPKEYEACACGLRYGTVSTAGSRYRPWDRFDGLRETDDAVVLECQWWFDERMTAEDVPTVARETFRAQIDGSRDYR